MHLTITTRGNKYKRSNNSSNDGVLTVILPKRNIHYTDRQKKRNYVFSAIRHSASHVLFLLVRLRLRWNDIFI